MANTIFFEGVDKLDAKLKKNITLFDVKKVVRHNGQQMQTKVQRNADFKKGYATGATKRSVELTIKNGELTAEVQPTTEYAPYVEWGTRYMEAQPFVLPGFVEQKEKFKKDMRKLVE